MTELGVTLKRRSIAVALFLSSGLLLCSCATTKEVDVPRPPAALEFVAGLEQTREITVEENLTYALGRLFGFDNVIVLVSSHAFYGEMEERQEMKGTENEPGWVFSRRYGPGEIERVTVAVVINEDVLTPEQKADIHELRAILHQIVEDGAGLVVEEGMEDRVSIVFMPFLY
jgi:flagellar biosynthesis/type III secretory pathway M-ring protein FliF/YscJ